MRELNLANIKRDIGFDPHEKQKMILKNQERFTVVVGGKRVGKTILAAYLALRELFGVEKKIWIVAPTIDLTGRIWEYLALWIDKYYPDVFNVNKQQKIIENKYTYSKLWAKTGENEAGLLGEGLDLAIIDEASRLKTGLWKQYIEPNLMDRNGRAFFISNPYGFNWFYDLYVQGLPENRAKNPDFISFVVPTAVEDEKGLLIGTNNPRAIKVKELERIKASTPPDVWRQEYLSVFQEGVGQRFKNFESCIDDSVFLKDENEWFLPPEPGHLYLIGVDLGKVEDFTVLTVMDRMTNRMVGFWKVNRVDWNFIKQRILTYAEAYNFALCTVDATGGASSAFTEDLMGMGVSVSEYVYSNKSKIALIDKLGNLMQGTKIIFPRIPDLINELRAFSYHFTTSGNLIYGSSKHDDCVNSLALACWELNDEPLDGSGSGGVWAPKARNFK